MALTRRYCLDLIVQLCAKLVSCSSNSFRLVGGMDQLSVVQINVYSQLGTSGYEKPVIFVTV